MSRSERRQRYIEQYAPEYSAFLAHFLNPDKDAPADSPSLTCGGVEESPFESLLEFALNQAYLRDWISKEVEFILGAFPPSSQRCPASVRDEDSEDDYSIYVGVGGNAYLHWKLAKYYEAEKQKERSDLHRKYAISAIELALRMVPRKYSMGEEISFYTGSAGIYSLAAVIYWMDGHLSKTEAQVFKLLELLPSCLSPEAADEVLYGRAGYLFSLIFVKKHINKEAVERLGLDGAAKKVFEAIMEEGKKNCIKKSGENVLQYSFLGKDYLGAAHGTTGILYALLQFPDWCRDPAHKPWIENTVDYIMSLQSEDGNFPVTMSEQQYHLYHWCHGAPGIVYTLYHAHKVLGVDKSILRSLDLALKATWEKGLLRKGFGLCHGIAGSGYCFLMMHRHTGADEYLYASYKMAEAVENEEVKKEVRAFMDWQRFKVGTPDYPYSLMEGLGGTICFFCDLLHPKMAAFPGYDGDVI